MKRRVDWVSRLRAAIDKTKSTTFKYGRFDCCVGAAHLWKAQTGVDVMKRLRRYSTARGAAMVLARAAPKGTGKARRLEAVAEIMAREAGLVEVEPLRAQRGFIVIVEAPTPDGMADALGIVDLDGVHILVPGVPGGWFKRPLSEARRAWGVA